MEDACRSQSLPSGNVEQVTSNIESAEFEGGAASGAGSGKIHLHPVPNAIDILRYLGARRLGFSGGAAFGDNSTLDSRGPSERRLAEDGGAV